ncbi:MULTISPECIES: hypothetical protein [Thermomonospora]|uniref:Transmembrane protein n=1 Tax=Thermomonospora curvata (strain ATCC 19995 / DSM 43183 / JCM 3096 / KCTC 9072 / NBRC 15933 / NCIMB 10081 / Henssen B9) TaxID=471852 RepID=D1AEB5_THECD|nr:MULTISPECIES: hypothetical protein [Thermomonospora]ACY95731.1 hypothetical protein Tcur_0124 [Thermomonospora curvata DSM 43183]PKK16318.1 MAG: hypothetical protein BUE48_000610 [Thermomonospora sp. CIF 1]
MERQEFTQGALPSPQEARAALEAVEQARESVKTTQWPMWYFVALGVWVAPLGLLSRMPTDFPRVLVALVALMAWMGLFSAIVALGARKTGVVPSFSREQVVHIAAILVPVAVIAALIGWKAGTDWALPSFSALEGAMIVLYALWVRHRSARSA